MSETVQDIQRRATDSTAAGITHPIQALHAAGVKSNWAYLGGFASIAISFAAWGASRLVAKEDRAQADRWGIFVGHWAPTFFALGIALRHEEDRDSGS